MDKFKTLTARLQNEATTAQTEPILAKSLIRQGAFWQMMGNFDEALTTLEAGLTIAQKLTLTSDIALALTFKGKAIQEQGNEADAQTLAKQALAISRQINDPRMIAQCYFDLAQIAMGSLADYPDVQHYVEQSLAASRQIGDQNIIAHCLHFTGYIAAISGDLTTAETYCQESLAIFAETGDRYGTAMAYGGLGLAAEGLGPAKFAEAKAYYEKRFAFCQEIGMRFHMTSSLYMLGNISNQMGEYQAALDYLHAGLKIARELQIPMKLTGLLAVLSNAHIELGHYNEARNCLKEALDAPHIPWIVAYFLEAIYVSTDPRLKVAQQADAEWRVAAIERLSFVCHHPSTWYTVRMRAKARLEELAVAMPPAQLKLAQSTGEAFDLWKVVDRLLAELQS